MRIVRKILMAALGWLLGYIWKKEGPKLLSKSVTIAGKQVPLSTFDKIAAVIPTVTAGIQASKHASQIAADVRAVLPAAVIAVTETLLNLLVPGLGTIEAAIVWLIEHSKLDEMSQDEVNKIQTMRDAGQ